MEKNTLILIIDPDKDLMQRLAAALLDTPHFSDAIFAEDGRRGLQLIKKHKPGVIVMEMLLEVYDGLYLLDYIHREMPGYEPQVYILTSLRLAGVGSVYQTIFRICPTSYVAIKPQRPKTVASNLCWLLEHETDVEQEAADTTWETYDPPFRVDGDLDTQIETFLRMLDHKLYLRRFYAAKVLLHILLTERPESIHMGQLYRRLAEEIGGTYSGAERLLRTFSQAAWENCTPFYQKHFPRGKMKNLDFYSIAYRVLCEKLHIPWTSPHRPPKGE